jgi:hypothetical protein
MWTLVWILSLHVSGFYTGEDIKSIGNVVVIQVVIQREGFICNFEISMEFN